MSALQHATFDAEDLGRVPTDEALLSLLAMLCPDDVDIVTREGVVYGLTGHARGADPRRAAIARLILGYIEECDGSRTIRQCATEGLAS